MRRAQVQRGRVAPTTPAPKSSTPATISPSHETTAVPYMERWPPMGTPGCCDRPFYDDRYRPLREVVAVLGVKNTLRFVVALKQAWRPSDGPAYRYRGEAEDEAVNMITARRVMAGGVA